MSEFEGKTKEQLEAIKISVESYMQAYEDILELITEHSLHTKNFLKQKLVVLEVELDKVRK